MANLAASGGYWVSTPASRIFAEPATITGSIGVFAVIPSFERALGEWGVSTDGVKTTPLSGQPDVVGGLSPEVSALLQANVEHTYGKFLGLVGQARGKSVADVDAMAQGRVWMVARRDKRASSTSLVGSMKRWPMLRERPGSARASGIRCFSAPIPIPMPRCSKG